MIKKFLKINHVILGIFLGFLVMTTGTLYAKLFSENLNPSSLDVYPEPLHSVIATWLTRGGMGIMIICWIILFALVFLRQEKK